MQFNLKRHVDTSLIRLRGSRARTNECDLDEVTQVDGLIGDILRRLEDDGLADNTIIVMMGDHGRAHLRGKQWPYDSGLMIPLIIYFPPGIAKPRGFEPGTVSDRIVEAFDYIFERVYVVNGSKLSVRTQARSGSKGRD